jgi:hypothetical protein
MHLPEQYIQLSATADMMPVGILPAAYPFQSWVLNLNVATKAHRDTKDCGLCLVVPVGRFEGGELCMVETGLVLEIQSGDVVVFPSPNITHFNLHFKGKLFYSLTLIVISISHYIYSGQRASLVLNTDAEMKTFVETNNGWADNVHYRS